MDAHEPGDSTSYESIDSGELSRDIVFIGKDEHKVSAKIASKFGSELQEYFKIVDKMDLTFDFPLMTDEQLAKLNKSLFQ